MTDFKIGDKVIAPRLWKGEASVFDIVKRSHFPIRVKLNDGTQQWFTQDGRYFLSDLEPSLYHAGTKITIEEAKPVKWHFVNAYGKSDGKILRTIVEVKINCS